MSKPYRCPPDARFPDWCVNTTREERLAWDMEQLALRRHDQAILELYPEPPVPIVDFPVRFELRDEVPSQLFREVMDKVTNQILLDRFRGYFNEG